MSDIDNIGNQDLMQIVRTAGGHPIDAKPDEKRLTWISPYLVARTGSRASVLCHRKPDQ